MNVPVSLHRHASSLSVRFIAYWRRRNFTGLVALLAIAIVPPTHGRNPDFFVKYGGGGGGGSVSVLPVAAQLAVAVTSPVQGITYPITVNVSVGTPSPSNYPAGVDVATISSYLQVSPSQLTFTAPNQTQTVTAFVNVPTNALTPDTPALAYTYPITTTGWPGIVGQGSAFVQVNINSFGEFGFARGDVPLSNSQQFTVAAPSDASALNHRLVNFALIPIQAPAGTDLGTLMPMGQLDVTSYEFTDPSQVVAITATVGVGAGASGGNYGWELVEYGWPAAGIQRVIGQMALSATSSIAPTAGQVPTVTAVGASNFVGGAATLVATATSSDPIIGYQWYKTGQPIAGATNASLVLPATTAADAGFYTIGATNSAGTGVALTQLYVAAQPPQIDIQPQPVSAVAGQTVQISVHAVGDGPFNYQWYSLSTGWPILGATANPLVFNSVQFTDMNSYLVGVTDQGTTVFSNPAQLSVVSPPVVTGPPQDATTTEGGFVDIFVNYVGTNPISFQWLKDGVAIPGATNYFFILNPATMTDSGQYSVVLSNYLGSTTSAAATVTILPVPPSITTGPQSQTVGEGSSVSLTVAAAGTAPFTYQWAYEGSGIAGATDAALTLEDVPTTASGNYTVTVANPAGTATSQPALLTVVPPVAPTISTQPSSRSVAYGDPAQFTVIADGTATLFYQWRHNGVPVAGATQDTISLASTDTTSAGNYDVVVSNSGGQVTSDEAVLTVGAPVPPSFLSGPNDVYAFPGSAFTLDVSVTGTLPISIQWMHDGAAIAGATDNVFRIDSAQFSDEGAYTAIATNVAGTLSSGSALVHIYRPTIITSQPQNVSASAGATVSFTVAATGDGNLGYNWGFTPSTGSTEHGQWFLNGSTLTIVNAQKGDEGSYSAVVYGANAVTSQAATLTITDIAPSLSGLSASVAVYQGGYLTLAPTIIGSTPITYQWFKDGIALPGATDPNFRIEGVQPTDAGSYSLQASNAVGNATSNSCSVSVSPIPAFAGGSGTISDPYQIATAAQLDAVRAGLNLNYALVADIDLTGINLQPLGDQLHPLFGTFDGRGHIISHWTYVAPAQTSVGLIPFNNGSVLNLSVLSATVSGYRGGILSAESVGTIQGCSVSGTLTATPGYFDGGVFGLLVGQSEGALSGCAASGTMVANPSATTVGGLVGECFAPPAGVVGCSANVTITATAPSDGNFGGLIGDLSGAISDSVSAGTLTVAAPATAGGLLGTKQSDGGVLRCASTVNVVVTGTSGEVDAGGLIGYEDQGPVSQCLAGGSVTSNSTDGRGFNGTAGLVGSNGTSSSAIDHCYATGAVSAPVGFAGGLVGDPEFGPITESYWDVNTSGQSTSGQVASGAGAGVGKTTSELQQAATFVGWDFNTVWRANAGAYPTLRGVYVAALSPTTIKTTNGGFTLVVHGVGFTAGSVVRWNGGARPTTFVDASTLSAAIPSSDLSSVTDFATIFISVQTDLGDVSNNVPFIVTAGSVAAAQTMSAPVGTTTTVSTAPTVNDTGGVSATLTNNTDTSGTATVSAVNYSTNPTTGSAFGLGSSYVDIQAIGVDSTDQISANFYYGSTITGTTEDALTLQYFDGATWQPVLSSGGAAPSKDTTDNLDGTISGGRFMVVFDNTSTPSVTSLTGTVFAVATPAPAKKNADKRKPVITSDPADLTVVAGSDATFSVAATSTSAMTYQWNFDGKKSPAIPGATNSTLVLHAVTSADAGTYSVTITNANGSTTSKKATLTVLPAPPAITSGPQSLTVSSGASATFGVMATGEGTLSYQWQFNGKAIAGAKKPTYTIDKAAQANAGSYSIVVSNDGGSTTSDPATLTVNAPSIVALNPVTVVSGGAAFTLTVSGSNFVNGDVVRWSGDDLVTTFVDANTLKAAVPKNELTPAKTAKTVPITIRAAGGDTSNAATLTVTAK